MQFIRTHFLSVSSDGRLVASGHQGPPLSIILWDLLTGSPVVKVRFSDRYGWVCKDYPQAAIPYSAVFALPQIQNASFRPGSTVLEGILVLESSLNPFHSYMHAGEFDDISVAIFQAADFPHQVPYKLSS